MTPGAKSQPLDDIRCVAWNREAHQSPNYLVVEKSWYGPRYEEEGRVIGEEDKIKRRSSRRNDTKNRITEKTVD
jgi:hypothetical protein